jgi:hypothetical protein
MWKTTQLLALGTLCGAVLVSVFAVYVFRDFDPSTDGAANVAFVSLCHESFWYAVIVSIGAAILIWPARIVLRLKGYSPRWRFCLLLGFGIALVQYVGEYAWRRLVPGDADRFRTGYMIFSIVFPAIAVICDCFRERKLAEAGAAHFAGAEADNR